MAATDKPEGLESKTFISGASGNEVNIGYSPTAVPFKDGMADGLTPGTTNTPGPYEAPAEGGGTASKSTATKTSGKTGTKTTGENS